MAEPRDVDPKVGLRRRAERETGAGGVARAGVTAVAASVLKGRAALLATREDGLGPLFGALAARTAHSTEPA